MPESAPLAHKPVRITFEEAAAVCEGMILALMWLRAADLRTGQRILIYGASGSCGTAGVQLARYFAAHVTAVCTTKNIELMRALGADEVIDYTQEDFTKNGETYDVIFDAVGKRSFRRCSGSLKRGGIYLPTDHWQNLFLAWWTVRIGQKHVRFPIPPRFRKQDVLFTQGTHRGGDIPGGHRSLLPVGASGRSNQVRRDGAEDRERRPYGEWQLLTRLVLNAAPFTMGQNHGASRADSSWLRHGRGLLKVLSDLFQRSALGSSTWQLLDLAKPPRSGMLKDRLEGICRSTLLLCPEEN
jgi:hypothetical protein